MLTVRVLDGSDGSVVAELDWVSATATHIMSTEAGWEVVATCNDELVESIGARTTAWWVVLIDHETGHVHGGPCRSIRVHGGTQTGPTAKFAGGNGLWYLNTSVTLPVAAQTSYPGQTTPRSDRVYVSHTAGTVQGSQAIHNLVDEQLNDSSVGYRERAIDLTAASTTALGLARAYPEAFTAEAFEPLLDTARRWANQSGLVVDCQIFGVAASGASVFKEAYAEMELQVRRPNDSATIQLGSLAARPPLRLSLQDGVDIEWVYEQHADELNYAWVGGSGKGVGRDVYPIPNQISSPVVPARWGVPIERFVNASSAETPDELINAGQLAIEKNLERVGVTDVKIRDAGVSYGRDYLCGDVVAVVVASVEYWHLILETEIEWSRSGKNETITTGIPEEYDDTLLDDGPWLAGWRWPESGLGRVEPPAALTPNLSAGTLALVDAYGPGGTIETLVFEHVITYAPGEEAFGFRTIHTLQQRVDGGAWTDTSGSFFTHSGTEGAYFLPVTEFETSIPSYTTSLEYRSKLEHPNYTTAYSTVFSSFSAPSFLTSPATSGTTQVGDTLTVVDPNASGSPAPTVTYQWRRDGSPISGETSSSYLVAAGDVGGVLSVVLTASNGLNPDASTTVTFGQPVAPVPSAPGAPTNFTAVNTSETFVVFDWDQPLADPGTPAADSFQLRYRVAGGVFTEGGVLDADPATAAQVSINSNLANPGETWEYSVRFINDTGPGPWAPDVSVTFPAATGFFTTADGGFFTTSDGGFFTVDQT